MTTSTSTPSAIVAPAAAPITAVVRRLTPGRLTRPTPCADFDVHGLLHHLMLWGPVLEAAGRKETVAPSDEADLVTGDWPQALDARFRGLVRTWSDPAAWEGAARILGPEPLPAAMVGGMVVTELLVHGWDLARAVGADPEWDPAVLAFAHDWLTTTSDMGREMGAYGPAVPVADTAGVLDRLLGITGRDPGWTPGT